MLLRSPALSINSKGNGMAKFDEDAYFNNKLNKYLDDQEEELSNCCEATIDEKGLCSDCLEHCESKADAYENAMWDKADAEHEWARDERDGI